MQTKPNTHKLSLIALTVPTWLHRWLVEFHGGSLCHTQSCTRTYNPINVCVLYVVEKRYIYEHTNTFQDSRWIEKENSNVCVLYFANLVSKSSYVMKNRVTLNRGVSFFFAFRLTPTTRRQNGDPFQDLGCAQQMGHRPKNFVFQQPEGKGGAPRGSPVSLPAEVRSSPSPPLCMRRPPPSPLTSLPEKREPPRSSSLGKRAWARSGPSTRESSGDRTGELRPAAARVTSGRPPRGRARGGAPPLLPLAATPLGEASRRGQQRPPWRGSGGADATSPAPRRSRPRKHVAVVVGSTPTPGPTTTGARGLRRGEETTHLCVPTQLVPKMGVQFAYAVGDYFFFTKNNVRYSKCVWVLLWLLRWRQSHLGISLSLAVVGCRTS